MHIIILGIFTSCFLLSLTRSDTPFGADWDNIDSKWDGGENDGKDGKDRYKGVWEDGVSEEEENEDDEEKEDNDKPQTLAIIVSSTLSRLRDTFESSKNISDTILNIRKRGFGSSHIDSNQSTTAAAWIMLFFLVVTSVLCLWCVYIRHIFKNILLLAVIGFFVWYLYLVYVPEFTSDDY